MTDQRSRFTKFVAGQVTNLAIGYLAGLTASTLVSQYFVKRGIGNLWGIATRRQALSTDVYEWLMFATSYLIGLIVMLSVNDMTARIRNSRDKNRFPQRDPIQDRSEWPRPTSE